MAESGKVQLTLVLELPLRLVAAAVRHVLSFGAGHSGELRVGISLDCRGQLDAEEAGSFLQAFGVREVRRDGARMWGEPERGPHGD